MTDKSTLALRLGIGLVQGLLLFLLYKSSESGVWPATQPSIFLPLLQVTVLAPLAVSAGWGHIRPRPLAAWAGLIAVVVAALNVYVAYKYSTHIVDPLKPYDGELAAGAARLFVALAPAIFIGHTLVVGAAVDGRRIAAYRTYFDYAWKHGVQLVAGVLFTLAFWALLLLGGQLFELINLDFLVNLIEKPWFSIPLTALAASAALHITDVRPGLVAGIRTLALTLLSWLLPVLAALVTGFLIALPFAGFDVLWATKFAATLLLLAAAALIVLINAVYQDGVPDKMTPPVLRYAVMVCAVALTPIILIAGYALALRVAQYGWTQDRIIAGACVLVGAGYAVGYARAVFRRGPWFAFLERSNIAMACVVPVLVFLLFSPLVDPDRISVNSQMARLASGETKPDALDVKYLRFDAGRYGLAALRGLQAGKGQDDEFAKRVTAALDAKRPRDLVPPSVKVTADNLDVGTPGKSLPASFLAQTDFGDTFLPACMKGSAERCDVFFIDIDGDEIDEILVLPKTNNESAAVFKAVTDYWTITARLPFRASCDDVRDALRSGTATFVPSALPDLAVAGRRFNLSPVDLGSDSCPGKPR